MSVILVPHDPAWSAQFGLEAPKLLKALGGWAWEGGVVFALEHIGSTSIPDLVAKPWIDIAVAVYPFPLEASFIRALEALGYLYKSANGVAGRQDFRLTSDEYHVHVFEAGGELFVRNVLFRDYLRSHTAARQRYERLKLELAQRYPHDQKAYSESKRPLIEQLVSEAHLWHIQKTGFEPVKFVARELNGVVVPWCVASGWGLDLLLARVTRFHDDFDVCIWREDQQPFLQYLRTRGWKLHVPVEGKYRPWQEGEFLELPIIQIHARHAYMPFAFLDVLLMESNQTTWLYRREPKVTMPKEEVMIRAQELFVLNPAITLLFKSRTADKEPRRKDQKDFGHILPRLTEQQKVWLENAFRLWMPRHPWRKLLKR